MNGGAPQTLTDPTRFRYTASSAAPVTIAITAYDLADNSATDSAQYLPYSPEQGAPRVAITRPAEGVSLRERATVSVGVVLENITAAQLFVEHGGNPSHPDNPAPVAVTRAADEIGRAHV